MKNLNIGIFIWIFVGFTAVVWALAAYFTASFMDAWKMAKLISSVVSVDTATWFVFVKWLWRWQPLQGWLIPFPDLNGTWKGYIRSNWVNPTTHEKAGPIPVMLTIRQTLFSIKCIQRTKESTSYSFAESFEIEKESNIKKLVYSYSNDPSARVQHRSTPHDGTATLEVVSAKQQKLRGQYWTNRPTTGDIELTFWRNERLDDISKLPGAHPVSQSES